MNTYRKELDTEIERMIILASEDDALKQIAEEAMNIWETE